MSHETDLDIDPEILERRKKPRPVALPPGLNLKLDVVVAPIMRGLRHPLRGLVLLILLNICSISWVLWCVEVRMAPLHSHHDAVREETDLLAEIESLEANYDGQSVAETESRLQAATAHILPNYAELAAWLHLRSESAREAGLLFEYQLAEVQAVENVDSVVRVPIDMQLKINVQSAAKDGYRRLLTHLRSLDVDNWTKEIKLAAMETENGGVRLMRVRVDMWMRDDPDSAGPIGAPESSPEKLDQALEMATSL